MADSHFSPHLQELLPVELMDRSTFGSNSLLQTAEQWEERADKEWDEARLRDWEWRRRGGSDWEGRVKNGKEAQAAESSKTNAYIEENGES